jgi:hypothetical protein
LECPTESNDAKTMQELLERRLAATAARIRRSLKPKKVALLDGELDSFVEKLASEVAGTELVMPQTGRVFRLEDLVAGSLEAAIRATPVSSL